MRILVTLVIKLIITKLIGDACWNVCEKKLRDMADKEAEKVKARA